MRSNTHLLSQEAPRWRVGVLDGERPSRIALVRVIEAAGGRVAVEAPPRLDSIPLIQHVRPDAVILGPPPSGAEPELLPRLASDSGAAIVLFGRRAGLHALRSARRARVMAFLLEPLRSAAELEASNTDLALLVARVSRDGMPWVVIPAQAVIA